MKKENRIWKIERLYLNEQQGEVNSNEKTAVDFDQIAESNRQFLAANPKDRVTQEILKKLDHQNSSRNDLKRLRTRQWMSDWVSPGVSYAAAIGCVLLGASFLSYNENTRTKGIKSHLNVYRQSGSKIERLNSESVLKPHDLIQISYVATKSKYGCIFSIDGKNKITVHYPASVATNEAGALEASKEVALPESYELDDSPKFEKFLFLFSSQTFEVQETIERYQTKVQLPNSIQVYEIEFKKN